MTDVDERVERGMELLDGHLGRVDWRGELSVADLDMASCSDCVLGQLFGSYHDGVEALDLQLDGDGECGWEYGFANRHGELTYSYLNRAWLEALR